MVPLPQPVVPLSQLLLPSSKLLLPSSKLLLPLPHLLLHLPQLLLPLPQLGAGRPVVPWVGEDGAGAHRLPDTAALAAGRPGPPAADLAAARLL